MLIDISAHAPVGIGRLGRIRASVSVYHAGPLSADRAGLPFSAGLCPKPEPQGTGLPSAGLLPATSGTRGAAAPAAGVAVGSPIIDRLVEQVAHCGVAVRPMQLTTVPTTPFDPTLGNHPPRRPPS